ncbi:hypothetical protein ACS0PU_000489 [Formica fusca]
MASKAAPIFPVSSLAYGYVVIVINTCVQHCALNRERAAIKVSMPCTPSPPALGPWIGSIPFTSMLSGERVHSRKVDVQSLSLPLLLQPLCCIGRQPKANNKKVPRACSASSGAQIKK